jgi:hypothetical protein
VARVALQPNVSKEATAPAADAVKPGHATAKTASRSRHRLRATRPQSTSPPTTRPRPLTETAQTVTKSDETGGLRAARFILIGSFTSLRRPPDVRDGNPPW